MRNGKNMIHNHKTFFVNHACSNSVNTPPQSLGCKNITGFPCAPILVDSAKHLTLFAFSCLIKIFKKIDAGLAQFNQDN